MVVVTLFNVIAILFAWLESRGYLKQGLKLSIFTIFIFLALRYDFGNDYMAYLKIFNTNYNYPQTGFEEMKGYEFGWFYLNRLFGLLGFFSMIAFLAGVTCAVLYRFIKKYVLVKYYWLAIFIYVFQPYNMVVLSSAMRQEVAGLLFLIAIDFILAKKYLKYILTIGCATLFHSTAMILFPLVLLSVFNWKLRYFHILLIPFIFLLPSIVGNDIFTFLDVYFSEDYGAYIHKNKNVQIGLGFALSMLINLFILIYGIKVADTENSLFYKIIFISMTFISLGFLIPQLDRLNLYFNPVMMVVFPMVFSNMHKKGLRLGFMAVIMLLTLYQFFIFFSSEVWRDAFSEYHTIFSAIF